MTSNASIVREAAARAGASAPKVTIIGGGIGGLAVANALQRAGGTGLLQRTAREV